MLSSYYNMDANRSGNTCIILSTKCWWSPTDDKDSRYNITGMKATLSSQNLIYKRGPFPVISHIENLS